MARIRKSLPDDIRRETKFFIEPFLNKEDGLLYYIDTRGFLIPLSQGDGSIYVADGTLLGDRTLTGAANFLHFADLSNFTVDTTGDINLDPGGEVAVGASRSISFDQAALGADVTAIKCRSNPRTQVAFVASGPTDTPNELWMNADTDVYLAPDSGDTIFNANLAFYTASGGGIADIDAATGKVLVSKEWVEQYGPAGSGTLNYIPRWTPDGVTLGDSTIQDDGTTIGIGIAPASVVSQVFIEGTNPSCITARNINTSQESSGLVGLAYGVKVTPTTHYNAGVYGLGSASDYANYGIIGLANSSIAPTLSSGEFVGGYFRADGATIANYGIYVVANIANTSDNIGLYVNTANSGAGDHYIGQFLDGGEGAGQVLTSDAAGHASWAAPTGAATSIYTGSGTVPTTTLATITDTLNFNGGKVGINVAPATNDFEVNGDTLLKTLTIGTTGQYGFPLNATISNDTQVLKYNHATNALIFSNETNTNIYTHDGTVGSTRTATITDTLQFIGGQVDVTAGTTDTGVTVLSSEKADMSNIVEFNDRAQGRVNSSAYITCAQFEVASDTRGFLPPRNVDPVTNILGPVEGLIAWDSTDNELQVFDGSDWITLGDLNNPKRTWNWGAARNNQNVTNQYIRTFNGALTNLCPYVVPFDCILTDLTCSTRDNETWVAEVREDPRPGGTETVIASISVTAANQDSNIGLSVALSAGDEIGFYCNGTGISYPHIQAWFKET